MSRMISRSLHARMAPSTRGDFYEVAWRDLGGGMGVQSLTIVRTPILLQDVPLIIVAVLCQSKNWVCYNMASLFIETMPFPGRCGRHDSTGRLPRRRHARSPTINSSPVAMYIERRTRNLYTECPTLSLASSVIVIVHGRS